MYRLMMIFLIWDLLGIPLVHSLYGERLLFCGILYCGLPTCWFYSGIMLAMGAGQVTEGSALEKGI